MRKAIAPGAFTLRSVAALGLAVAIALTPTPRQASAAFHIMVIDEVMAGAAGDETIQFVDLKMQANGQDLVAGTVLRFFDGAGVQTGTFTFPSNVSNGASGSSILIGTSQFAKAASVAPDFIMAAVINPTDGRVCFTNSSVSIVVDCVAYGNFTPSNTGFGTPAPALPTSGNSSLKRISDTNNNSADFTLDSGPAEQRGPERHRHSARRADP